VWPWLLAAAIAGLLVTMVVVALLPAPPASRGETLT